MNEVPGVRSDVMPYGGVKDSGAGREGPPLRDRRTHRHPHGSDSPQRQGRPDHAWPANHHPRRAKLRLPRHSVRRPPERCRATDTGERPPLCTGQPDLLVRGDWPVHKGAGLLRLCARGGQPGRRLVVGPCTRWELRVRVGAYGRRQPREWRMDAVCLAIGVEPRDRSAGALADCLTSLARRGRLG